MEQLGRVLISLLLDSSNSYIEDSCSNLDNIENIQQQRLNLEERTRAQEKEKKFKARTVNLGLNTIVAALSEDTNWKVVQARRKREKEDLFNKNPSFDPIFMKV